jgi:hypothetical protein
MRKILVITTLVIGSWALSGCAKPSDDTRAAASGRESAVVASSVTDNASMAATATAGSSGSGGFLCAFDNGGNKDWHATINDVMPKPPGGRPLAITGKVRVKKGYKATLTAAGMEKSSPPGLIFKLELVEDGSNQKDDPDFSVSASVPPPVIANRVIIDCGGTTLTTVPIFRVSKPA